MEIYATSRHCLYCIMKLSSNSNNWLQRHAKKVYTVRGGPAPSVSELNPYIGKILPPSQQYTFVYVNCLNTYYNLIWKLLELKKTAVFTLIFSGIKIISRKFQAVYIVSGRIKLIMEKRISLTIFTTMANIIRSVLE